MSIFGDDITAEDLIAGNYAGSKKPPTKFGKALRYGLDQPTENIATTLGALGYDDTAGGLRNLIEGPENYESAAARFMNPEGEGYSWKDLPLATVEQAGQLAGSIGLRAAGAGAGTAMGGPVLGAILAFGGPALFEAVQIAGPVALDRAKNRDPQGVDKEPNGEDWAGAMGTAAFSGVLNAIGAFGIPGLNAALGTTGKTIAQTLGAGVREGVTEGLQGVTEQVGSTAFTDKGLTIDPKQAIGEGLIGGTTGMVATVPAAVTQAVDSMNSTVDPTLSSLIEDSASASPALTAETVEPLALPAGEDPTISETAMASVPQSETYQDFNILDPILSIPEDLSQAEKLFTSEDIWPRLPVKLRNDYIIESKYKENIPELFKYVKSDLEKDIERLFSPKKTKKAYGDEINEINNLQPGRHYLFTNIITKDPDFKEKVKQKWLEHNLGLDESEGGYFQDYMLTEDYAKKSWRAHKTLMRASNDVLYEEIASKYIAPSMLKGLNDIVKPGSLANASVKEFAKNLLIDTKFDTSNPKFKPIIESVMDTEKEFDQTYPYIDNIFKVLELGEQKEISETFAEDEINNETSRRLFEGLMGTPGITIEDHIEKLESQKFFSDLRDTNFFQTKLEKAQIKLPKEFSPRDIKRLENQFYEEIERHPEIYREDFADILADDAPAREEQDALISALIQNMEQAKRITSLSKGLPKDVAERFSGHAKLKTLSEAEGPDTSGPLETVIGPLPSFVASRGELATAENGPLDPNFLTYSLSRSHLDKLRNKGIASLSGSEMLTYLSTPYKRLPQNLKEISEAVPKKQQGEDAQDTAERINEIRDNSVKPYLESQGELPVSIEYIQKLIDDNASRISITEARSWEGDSLRHGDSYRISGPVEGLAEYTVNHVPLLKPEEQTVVDSDDISAGKKILEDSPNIYTERDSTHNWSKNKWNLRGLGTVGWMRGSLRKFGDNKIGALLGESQSYWIQKTREAMSKAKNKGFSPTKIFRSDFQEQQTDIQNSSQPELEQLIFEYEEGLPAAREEIKNTLTQISGKKTKQYPEGYYTAFLSNPQTKKALIDNFLRDVDGLYTEDKVISKYSQSSEGVLSLDPEYEIETKKINLEENEKVVDNFIQKIVDVQPAKREFAIEFTEENLRQKRKEQIEYMSTPRAIRFREVDDKIDGYQLRDLLDDEFKARNITIFGKDLEMEAVYDSVENIIDQSIKESNFPAKEAELQKNTLEKFFSNSPAVEEHLKLLKVIPDRETRRDFERSLTAGEAVIQPDPPFRNKFNQMNLRAWIVQSMKDGLEFVLVPATKNGKEYSTTTQKKYGQPGAPMGNYVSMLKEGEKIAKEYGLPIQTVTIDVGNGKTGEVTSIDIRPLYEIVTEGGFKGGYKKGGLVTKAQGAGYSMNLGDYGRNYT